MPNNHKELTQREHEIMLVLIVTGKSNVDIGKQLSIEESTVKAHMSSAMIKLKANNRTHAALIYMGAIPPP